MVFQGGGAYSAVLVESNIMDITSCILETDVYYTGRCFLHAGHDVEVA